MASNLTGCTHACQSSFKLSDVAGESNDEQLAIAIRNISPQSNRATIRACARIGASRFDALLVSNQLCIPVTRPKASGGRYLDVLATLAFLRRDRRSGSAFRCWSYLSARRVDGEAGRDDPGLSAIDDPRHRRRLDEAGFARSAPTSRARRNFQRDAAA